LTAAKFKPLIFPVSGFALRTIHLPTVRVYTGGRKVLRDNSSFPIGSLAEQSEPIGDKTRITGVGGLHTVRFQKVEFIITNAVSTSNPAYMYIYFTLLYK
jgi:hypothetical protein